MKGIFWIRKKPDTMENKIMKIKHVKHVDGTIVPLINGKIRYEYFIYLDNDFTIPFKIEVDKISKKNNFKILKEIRKKVNDLIWEDYIHG